jgi:hypothetical protein
MTGYLSIWQISRCDYEQSEFVTATPDYSWPIARATPRRWRTRPAHVTTLSGRGCSAGLGDLHRVSPPCVSSSAVKATDLVLANGEPMLSRTVIAELMDSFSQGNNLPYPLCSQYRSHMRGRGASMVADNRGSPQQLSHRHRRTSGGGNSFQLCGVASRRNEGLVKP